MRLRLDLGLGNQPIKLAAIIVAAWAALCLAMFHDRIGAPLDATTRDILILLAVPPVMVLACAGLVQWLGTDRT